MDAVPEPRSKWPALVIAAVVFGWGVYLAIGAATHESHDVRKSVVILACTLMFLIFWFVFLLRAPRGQAAVPAKSGWASLLAMIASLVTNGLVVLAFVAPDSWSELARGRSLLCALPAGLVSCMLAAIGLSRPAPNAGYRWGLAAFALVGVALVTALVGLAVSSQA